MSNEINDVLLYKVNTGVIFPWKWTVRCSFYSVEHIISELLGFHLSSKSLLPLWTLESYVLMPPFEHMLQSWKFKQETLEKNAELCMTVDDQCVTVFVSSDNKGENGDYFQ